MLQECKGRISLGDLATVCWQYSLPTEPELLAQVMDYCDVDRDGFINYEEFSNFLNYNMPSGIAEAEVSISSFHPFFIKHLVLSMLMNVIS